ncbi:pseudaminic acid cytidylyltransferase [Rhodobacterales bacterium 52_120_T64]|nr:pseudaminic acid cytidylyltransferase [Rhodobacterales bacterium 52_120_T64]
MKIAVIPARGGSKRIPRKNIKPFCGKPMIAWSIEAALASGCFERVIVSTDDPEIAAIASQYGAEAPFTRPESLSDDHTGTTPVIRHATDWMSKSGAPATHVCCIYATAPFVRPIDIQDGFVALENADSDYAFSVTSYAFPIQRAVKITPQNRVEMFEPDQFQTRSQDLEEAYHDAAQFYWGTADAWLAERPIFGAASVPVILPRHRVQDIDTPEDWTTAELMFKAMDIQK